VPNRRPCIGPCSRGANARGLRRRQIGEEVLVEERVRDLSHVIRDAVHASERIQAPVREVALRCSDPRLVADSRVGDEAREFGVEWHESETAFSMLLAWLHGEVQLSAAPELKAQAERVRRVNQ